MNTTSAIEIHGLIKRHPAFTLGPLDFTVPRGAIYGLIGPNGTPTKSRSSAAPPMSVPT